MLLAVVNGILGSYRNLIQGTSPSNFAILVINDEYELDVW